MGPDPSSKAPTQSVDSISSPTAPNLVVVDIGNTRIKWGRCENGNVAEVAAVPPDEYKAWSRQWDAWGLTPAIPFCLAGVHPARRETLAKWLRDRCSPVKLLSSYRDLPINVALPIPAGVGIDRLLDAVAANARKRPHAFAIIVDAGSAVTVDVVDAQGAFRGGVIFPGFGLMAKSLHDFTALLPIVSPDPNAKPPGESTVPAIQAGIMSAIVGGVQNAIAKYESKFGSPCDLFITGGDGAIIAANLHQPAYLWPEMTLEGVRISGGG